MIGAAGDGLDTDTGAEEADKVVVVVGSDQGFFDGVGGLGVGVLLIGSLAAGL